jgi:hypothetical protein
MAASLHPQIPPLRRRVWMGAQVLVFAIGLTMFGALIAAPRLGLALLWNVLVPAAPLLLVLAPGLWRNICPLASVALSPQKLGWSRGLRIRRSRQAWIALGGVVLLLILVPARRIAFDRDGMASAILLAGAATLALGAGLLFESKSGWCAGLCPLRAVETLYGERPLATFDNAHCKQCVRCTEPCPDSQPAPRPGARGESLPERIVHHLMVGAFPGFIWGWFHVPDADAAGWGRALEAYALPLGSGLLTWMLYASLRSAVQPARRARLVRVFAMASVGCYYWYRLPGLLGWSLFEGDGTLVDLRAALPQWTPLLLQVLVLALAAAAALAGAGPERSWQRRPAPARRKLEV